MTGSVSAQSNSSNRLLFVDNLRVFLTILVIVFHLMITYAGTGSWYYNEGREDFATGLIGAWFLAVNQAYFMGFFLLISAYFVPASYDRKGAGRFLKDRLVRLGIPVALYSWIIRPFLVYLDPIKFAEGRPSLWNFLADDYLKNEAWFGAGPLWFIETLLIFSALYVLWRLATRDRVEKQIAETPFPGNGHIALLGLLITVAAFFIRVWLPLGWSFKPLNLQFPFFAQYIAMFIVGLVAARRRWFESLPDKAGRLWLGVAIFLTLMFIPLVILGGGMEEGFVPFQGGWRWQSFAYSAWESFLCVSMCIGLIYLFRRRYNTQGKMATFFSRNAYTAYLIHEPLIVVLAYALIAVEIYPLLKFALVSMIAVPLCFAVGGLIRKLPYADRVL